MDNNKYIIYIQFYFNYVCLFQFEDGTYFVHVVSNERNEALVPEKTCTPVPEKAVTPAPIKFEEPVKSPAKIFKQLPAPMCKIENGQRVVISDVIDRRFVLRTQECCKKLKAIEKTISELSLEAVSVVQQDQHFLCYNEAENQYQRVVVITKNEDNTVKVKYLDYYKTQIVSITSLRNSTEQLCQEPITYILSPVLTGFQDTSFTKEPEAFVNGLIKDRVKAMVVICFEDFNVTYFIVFFQVLKGDDFDLAFTLDNEPVVLSQYLSNLENPTDPNKVFYSKMKKYKPSLGPGNYLVNSFSELYVVHNSDDLADNLEKLIKSEDDLEFDASYDPQVDEVCFAAYGEGNYIILSFNIM